MRRTAVLVASAVLLSGACGGARHEWKVDGDPQRVAVFFHGAGVNGDPMIGPPAALMHRLHAQGWKIVSATAGGDAWGDPASVRDYRAVIASLHARTTVGIAESMGALPAVQVAGMLDRLVLVSPVVNLRQMLRTPFAPSIRRAWHGIPPAGFIHRLAIPVQVIADPADPVVQTATNGQQFARVNRVRLLACHGGHVAADCFDRVRL